ncbi:MAG: transglycosylase SLT domain-containing protein [Mangrovicoccus sp.]|nr:transglycosylase SLT domain-containing protein [Mangrovicoccus sp.]
MGLGAWARRSAWMIAALALAGCAAEVSRAPSEPELPALRWDHLDRGEDWTRASLVALDTHGAPLVTITPRDIAEYCPAYPDASEEDRAAFWAGLLSALSYHESTWRETAVGGGGRWYGLTQILPGTARGYGCEAQSGAALKNGEKNLSCAVRIMAVTVPRDGVVSQGMGGVAADWGPFHSSRKRNDMKAWTRAQPFCQG